MRNNPSFKSQVSVSTCALPSRDSFCSKFLKPKAPVAVHKTEVNKPQKSVTTTGFISRECQIHKKPHSLKKCRAFRERTLEERKAYLKEHNICFRCCDSSTHQARNCKEEITCSECNSDKHIAALHAGPAPWTLQNPQIESNTFG